MSTKRRKDMMWVSNNRVLVGGSKKITGRNPNFDTEETKVLISLWGDPKVQKTLITTHKKHAVIAKLADRMREYGYYRSPEEINTRIKNLKCFYNRIKKDIDNGLAPPGEPTWKHYQAMDEILTRPIFSVRPNEIPKPSLRYRMEEELKEREEREREKRENDLINKEKDNNKNNKEKSKNKNNSNDNDDDGDDDDDDDEDEDDEDEDGDDNDDDLDEDDEDYVYDEDDEDDDDDIECAIKKAKINSNNVDSNKVMTSVNLRSMNDVENEFKKPKSEIQSNENSVEETPMVVVPKEEPIDIDDYDDSNNENENKGMEHNKTKTNHDNNKMTIITTVANRPAASTVNATTVTSSGGNFSVSSSNILSGKQSFVIANHQKTASLTSQSSNTGKISLVPTNFLLKPQQQPIAIRPHPQPTQHRLVYTKASTPIQSTNAPNKIVTSIQPSGGISNATTPGQPLKVLFVNTLQSHSGTQNHAAAHSPVTIHHQPSHQLSASNINIAALQKQQQKQQQQHQQQQFQKQQKQNVTAAIHSRSTTATTATHPIIAPAAIKHVNLTNNVNQKPSKRRKLAAVKENELLKLLLKKIVKMQSETLEVDKQRLELEKQRFNFEKLVLNKFLNSNSGQFQSQQQNLMTILSSASPPLISSTTTSLQQNSSQQQGQQLQQQQQINEQNLIASTSNQTSSPQLKLNDSNNDSTEEGQHLLIPKIEKIDDYEDS